MPAPSDLAIAAKAVERLVKEETYYRAELVKQEKRVADLQAEIDAGGPDLDPNAEFVLSQEKKAVDETNAVFAPLRRRTADAVAKLEEQIALSESGGAAPAEELQRARESLRRGQAAVHKAE